MVVPALPFLQRLRTKCATPVLADIQHRSFVLVRHVFQHAFRSQLLSVHLPYRVKGVVFPLDLFVPHDLCIRKLQQSGRKRTICRFHGCSKFLPILDALPVTAFAPGSGFIRMSPSRPAHQAPVDQAVHPTEGFLRHHRLVVPRPAPKDWVQFGNEILLLRR